jgi:hypothetical protein
MSLRKFSIPMLALGLSLLVPASKAQASYQSETFSHTTAQAGVPFSEMFTLPTFDTSLGMLVSVQITLSSSVTTDLDIYSKGTYTFTNATGTVPIVVTGPDGSSIMTSTTATVASGNLVYGDNLYNGITGTGSSSLTLTTGLSSYESVGGVGATFNAAFNGATYGGTTSAPPNQVFFGGGASAGGTTTITYTYAPFAVAEPASAVLVALGLCGPLVVRRLRQRAA